MDSDKPDDAGEPVDKSVVAPQTSIVHKDADDSVSRESSLHQVQSIGVPEAEFKPSRRLYVAFATLAVITLMVALDGTSLSVALPVSLR